MHIRDPKLIAELAGLSVALSPGASLADLTYLGIGGATDLLRIAKHESIPPLLAMLEGNHIPYRFLGGGSNLLVGDGELPWVILQLAKPDPEVVLEDQMTPVRTLATGLMPHRYLLTSNCDAIGAMEGLIGVPGTVGGASE
jgi:UDP-N-acetylmuramate dehydrogenase